MTETFYYSRQTTSGLIKKHIIESIGGLSATGRILGVTPAAVHRWVKKNRIPKLRVYQLQALRPDLFKPHS
jgi:predicted transcriptional regulator